MTAKKAARKKKTTPAPVPRLVHRGVLGETGEDKVPVVTRLSMAGEPVLHVAWSLEFPARGPFFSARLSGAYALEPDKFQKLDPRMQRIEVWRGAHNQWLALASAIVEAVEVSKKTLFRMEDGEDGGSVQ